MKKMNLKFFSLKAKIVLPLFLLFGLFMFSATSASAQHYLEGEDAVVAIKQHVVNIKPMMAKIDPNASNPELEAFMEVNNFRHKFARYLLNQVTVEGNSTVVSLENTEEFFLNPPSGRQPVRNDVLNTVKQEYEQILLD